MKRIDSAVHLMVATEEQAESVEAELKDGPLMLLTADSEHGDFTIVMVSASEPEAHMNKALRILG